MNFKYYAMLIIILLTSCENEINKPTKDVLKKGVGNFLMGDNSEALLLQASGVDYDYFNENVIYYGGSVQAFFSDDLDSLFSPDSVILDGNLIDESGIGTYRVFNEDKCDSTGSIDLSWDIYGYVDSNHTITQELANPLKFTNFNTLDTISKSSGININYSGAENGDLTWWIQSGQFVTDSLISSDSLCSIPNSIIHTQSDNGILSISSSQISGLGSNRYYLLILQHLKDTTINSNGRKFDLKSFSETEISFYLDN